jgi:hypothetical protein
LNDLSPARRLHDVAPIRLMVSRLSSASTASRRFLPIVGVLIATVWTLLGSNVLRRTWRRLSGEDKTPTTALGPASLAMPPGADVRAERLRIALAVLDVPHDVDPRECPPLLSAADVILVEDIDEDDVALLNACLEIERELRERAFAAIARLSVEVAGRHGDLNDRIRALPPGEVSRALLDLDEAGWFFPAPSEL